MGFKEKPTIQITQSDWNCAVCETQSKSMPRKQATTEASEHRRVTGHSVAIRHMKMFGYGPHWKDE